MNRNILFILVGILGVNGCNFTPEYKRPEAPIPAEWPASSGYQNADANSSSRCPLNWQNFFADEKLRNTIELALNNNRDLRIAALNVERAQAIYRIQRAELYPTVDAGATASKERVPGILSGTGRPLTTELYNVNVGISAWELDLFGRLRSLKQQALQLYFATEQARRSAEISLVAEVANAYFMLAADRERLKLAQDTFSTQQDSYNLIKRRFDNGISSEIDLRQAQTRVEAARADIARYTSQVSQDENLLSLLAGSTVPGSLLAENLDTIASMDCTGAILPSELLQKRPDVLEAENQLKAANANIGAARAAFFPRVALTTSIGTTSDELSGLFGAGSRTWLFAPQATVPIFDSRLRGGLEAVKAEHAIFLSQYERAIQTAFREVADALAVRATVGEQLAAQESLVNAADVTYRLSEKRYLQGIDSFLVVLDSQRSLYTAQQGLIDIRQARLANLLTLYKVMGGGE